jgi:hypothetical protein
VSISAAPPFVYACVYTCVCVLCVCVSVCVRVYTCAYVFVCVQILDSSCNRVVKDRLTLWSEESAYRPKVGTHTHTYMHTHTHTRTHSLPNAHITKEGRHAASHPAEHDAPCASSSLS